MAKKPKRNKKIRSMSLVKFDWDKMPIEYHKAFPFSQHDVFVYLGEIKQMPGHGVFINTRSSQVYCCYHTDEFIELTNEEV